MSGNPFEDSGGNPFETSGTSDGQGNPFETSADGSDISPLNPFDDNSDEEIVIPTFDDNLNNVISNPFSTQEMPKPSLVKPPNEEIELALENVNLTYRARTDAAVLASIDRTFFDLDEFELTSKILIEYEEERIIFKDSELLERIQVMKNQLKSVTHTLSAKIQKNKDAYLKHQSEIDNMNGLLEETTVHVSNTRSRVKDLKMVTRSPLLIISKNNSLKRAHETREILYGLKTLIQLEQTLNELLRRSDFTEAIKLMQNCKNIAETYSRFPCCYKLSARLSSTTESAVSSLDTILSSLTSNYDDKRFNSLLEAYDLLKRPPGQIMEKIVDYTEQNIESCFRKIVGVETPSTQSDTDLYTVCADRIKTPADLCNTLTLFSSIIWQILSSFTRIQQRYRKSDTAIRELAFSKLTPKKAGMWDIVQGKCSLLISVNNLSDTDYTTLLHILTIVKRLSEVGYEFCQSESTDLQDALKESASSFFTQFHSQKVEELLLFLTQESWEPCPLRQDFEFNQLKEFEFLRKGKTRSKAGSGTSSCSKFLLSSTDPFDRQSILQSISNPTDDDLENGSDEEDPELLADLVIEDEDDHKQGSRKSSSSKSHHNFNVMMTNTSMSVLRLCGQYIQMADVLQPVAVQVIQGITVLYDVYLWSVHRFFTDRDRFTTGSLGMAESHFLQILGGNVGYVDFSPDNFWGLGNRIIAVESVKNLAKQFTKLRRYLEAYIPENREMILSRFYSNSAGAIPTELTRMIMVPFCRDVMNPTMILSSMSNIKWDIKMMSDHHSPYVGSFVEQSLQVKKVLHRIGRNIKLAKDLEDIIWVEIIRLIGRSLVNGFAEATKCTPEGRALMNFDYQQLLHKVEKISGIRSPPDVKIFTETYIRAYYFTEDELGDFIANNSAYSKKHLTGLVHQSGASLSRRTRQRLLQLTEDS